MSEETRPPGIKRDTPEELELLDPGDPPAPAPVRINGFDYARNPEGIERWQRKKPAKKRS